MSLVGAGVRPFHVACVYRTGAYDVQLFLQSLEAHLSLLQTKNILISYINLDLFKAESDFYTAIFQIYNHENIFTVHTCVTSTSSTCIDQLLVNFDDQQLRAE